MSIASEISRLQTAKADLKTAIEGKGVTVLSSATLDDYADLVNAIQTGGGGSIGNITKYQSVSVTPSDSSNITISHNFGTVPKIVLVTIQTATGSANTLEYGVFDQRCGAMANGEDAKNAYFVTIGSTGASNAYAYFTDSVVTIRRASSSRYFDTTATYTVELYG